MQDEFEGKRRVFAADHLKQNRADGFPGQKQVAGVRRFIVLIKFGIDAPVDFITAQETEAFSSRKESKQSSVKSFAIKCFISRI